MFHMTSIDEFVRELPWTMRVRIWFKRFKVRKAIREGWRPTVQTLCFDCLHPIVEADDEACVCVQCGGRNRREPLK